MNSYFDVLWCVIFYEYIDPRKENSRNTHEVEPCQCTPNDNCQYSNSGHHVPEWAFFLSYVDRPGDHEEG
jgi:hypothetical protein